MTMPGMAPPTPACHEPEVSIVPSSNAAVRSPRYQTLPARSWAYQSSVLSSTVPLWVATSLTTVALTPRIVFVRSSTLTTSRWVWPSLTPLYTHTDPGFQGRYWLVMWRTKWLGLITAWLRREVAALDPLIIAAATANPASRAEPATARAIVVRFITFLSVRSDPALSVPAEAE